MVALQFFHVVVAGAAILVFAAVVALVLWWRDEGMRAANRSRARTRHTALNPPAPAAQPTRREVAEEVELSA